jgi:hypothetical protein
MSVTCDFQQRILAEIFGGFLTPVNVSETFRKIMGFDNWLNEQSACYKGNKEIKFEEYLTRYGLCISLNMRNSWKFFDPVK